MNHARTARSGKKQWVHRLEERHANDVIVSRGTIVKFGRPIDYYTTQPSAGQWIALGVVPLMAGLDSVEATHRVIVGTSDTESGAIEALESLLESVTTAGSISSFEDQFVAASHPSDWFG
ncbi:MAG TPA: hypothetical protein VHV31_06615 [Nitrolancea sp.]|nr:hypothetical protein [Nitrolancea sp.]